MMTEESSNPLINYADKVIEEEVFNVSLIDGRGVRTRAILLYVQL
jgi:hypothetical protein